MDFESARDYNALVTPQYEDSSKELSPIRKKYLLQKRLLTKGAVFIVRTVARQILSRRTKCWYNIEVVYNI